MPCTYELENQNQTTPWQKISTYYNATVQTMIQNPLQAIEANTKKYKQYVFY